MPWVRHIKDVLLRSILLGGVLLAASGLPGAAFKLDSLTVGSRTYSNVVVLGANATDLYFSSDEGLGNAKLKYLDTNLQQRLRYDPKAAAETEKQQAEDDLLYQTALVSKAAGQAEKAALAAKRAAATSEESLADPISDRSLLGQRAPDLKVDKWLGEKPALEGKCLLVAFWMPWSIPSRKAIPELNALQTKFAEKLVVVGVTSEPEEEVRALTEPKLEFASALDAKGKLSAAAGVTSVPSVLLVDSKGIVRYQGHPAALTEKKLAELLRKAAEQ
jgi:thiol-disulfide isomerase/thioredoxin